MSRTGLGISEAAWGVGKDPAPPRQRHQVAPGLRQRRAGKNPIFHLSEHPEIAPGVSKTIWK